MPQPKTNKPSTKKPKAVFFSQTLVVTGLAGFLASFLLLGIASSPSDKSVPATPEGQVEYVPGEVIVKFKPVVKGQLEKEAKPQKMGLVSVDEISKQNQAQKVEKVFKGEDKNITSRDEEKLPKGVNAPDLSTVYKMSFSEYTDVQKVVAEYENDPAVEYAEPNYKMETSLTPNDPYLSSTGTWGQSYDDLWGLKKTNVELAWDTNVGSADVLVAVIDTGIDYNHEDLADNIWVNTDEIAGNSIDDDNNGYVDDVYGYDFYNNDADPIDDHGHGTHVSGTIAAVTNNGKGVAGTSWNSKVMGVKFLSGGGSGWISDAVSSIEYAADNGADIISNSWGGWGRSQTLQDAVNYAYSKGAMITAAAGNSNWDTSNYQPAGLENVVTVAATDYTDSRASFSNYGDEVDVAAPGVDTLSLKAAGTSMGSAVGDKYTRASGTSMACPHVSGAAALIWSENPNYTNQEVEQILETTADDLGDIGFDPYFGYGRINSLAGIQGEPLPVSATNSAISVDSSTVYIGQYATITITLKNTYNIPVSGKEITLSSNRGTDTITPLQSHTNADGKFLANISSTSTGTSVISARDITDGVNINQTQAVNFAAAPDTTAPGDISSPRLEAGNKQVQLSWVNPSASDFAGVKVVRKEGSTPQNVTDGSTVYNGRASSYLNTGLTNGTTYYYAIFSYDEVPNYSAGRRSAATPRVGTPAVISNFRSVAGNGQAVLTWSNPDDSNFAGVKIVRKEGGNPQGPTDGTEVYRGDGELHIDTGLATETVYYYGAFSYNNAGGYSNGIYAVAGPISNDTSSPGTVSGLKVTPLDSKILLVWNNPSDADFAGVKVVRKEGDYPANAQDGTTVYQGAGTSYLDSNLANGATYYYTLFSFDGSLNYSSVVTESKAQATPNSINIITGTGPGGGPQIRAFNDNGDSTGLNFFAYDRNFKGGTRVTTGDIDADGQDEIIVGAGTGGGPQIRVFESDGQAKPIQFFAFHPDSRTGVDVAAGDVDGDGKDEIAVSQLANGEAWVKVYRYDDGQTIMGEWLAFPAGVNSGATVAMGDVDRDGLAEIIVGAGTGGGPQVRVFEYNGEVKPIQFFAFHPDSRTGVDVAAGDVDGDGKDEIAVSQLANGEAWVKVYRYNDEQTVITAFRAYSRGVMSGANIDLIDVDSDGETEIVTGAGNTGGPHVRAFEMYEPLGSISFLAYGNYFRGGVDVVGGRW
ncbi:MAG: S8 family serine peptidase [Parcubacteria group bacterium]|nr:S8 family serine peptidase [Parcubacteria group bacterium]